MKQILILMALGLLLTACAPQTVTETVTPTIPDTTPAVTEAPTANDTAPQLTFTLYTGNKNADGFITETVTVSEISAATVLEQLIEAGALPDNVQILSLTAEGSTLKIDFNSAFYDYLCTMGTSGELILIGSVVNTFLDAFEAESIFLTAQGKILESGHVIYDEPLTFVNLP